MCRMVGKGYVMIHLRSTADGELLMCSEISKEKRVAYRRCRCFLDRMTPEKVHLITNHLPVLGSLISAIVLVVGLVLKNRSVLYTGLGISVVTMLALGVVMGNGEEAYARYLEDGEVAGYITPEGQEMLIKHEELAHKFAKLGYVSLLVALLGGGYSVWKKKGVFVVSLSVVVLNLVFFALSVKTADLGGKIRRPDFITAP